jgi:GT2 family glycosyltransferase/spore maturation protein CgeB
LNAVTSAFRGFVERVSHDAVSGWAVDLQQPERRVEVELLIDGAVIASTKANLFRSDLAVLGFGQSDYAFRFQLPTRRIITIPQVRVAGSGHVLTTIEQAPDHEGVVESLAWSRIAGWAWRVGLPDVPVELELLLAGRTLRAVSANMFRQDLVDGGIGRGVHAFECSLAGFVEPAEYRPRDVQLLFRLTGHAVYVLPSAAAVATKAARTPARQSRGPRTHRPAASEQARAAIGFSIADPATPGLEAELVCERGLLRGWIVNRLTRQPQWVEVSLDDEVIWCGMARRLETVGGSGSPARVAAGLRVQLPPPSDWTATRRVAVRTATGAHVPGSPLIVPFGDQYLGNVERVERHGGRLTICGWCIDATQPSSRVPLSLFRHKTLVLQAETDQRRSDLGTTGFDAPFGGFELTLADPDQSVVALDELTVYPGRSLRPLPVGTDAIRVRDNAPTAAPADRALTLAEDEVEGTIDEVSDRFIRGWARNRSNPDAMVVLDCFIDGVLYATTSARRFRGDLKKHFGDHGYHEFLVELTPALRFQQPGRIEVTPRVGVNLIRQKISSLKQGLPRSKVIATGKTAYLSRYRLPAPPAQAGRQSIAVVVINRDGASLLSSFLAAFHRTNTYERFEIIVVDHGSTDDSAQICGMWGRSLPLRWFQRYGNFSFSDSNNFAAARTDAALLLFINNDVTLTEDVLPRMAQYMSDPAIGCVGIRLSDDSPMAREDSLVATQHLGVHFDASHRNFAVEAFESRFARIWHQVADGAMEVPAVTGAFMVVRRDEFMEMGGFNAQYFYGYEDVDLCLMYRQRGKKVVAALDQSALHLRGFSRDRMDHRFNQARMRNRSVLDERFGFWMRRMLAEQRFARPGFWTSTVPRIAFAVTEASEVTLAGDYFTALELASQLAALFPCECGFVEHEGDKQYDLANFDVLIAMRDDYDPRRIQNAPPHLITIAWIRNWFDRFAVREAAQFFDCIWASSPTACDVLRQALGKPVALVPIATNWYRFQAGKRDPALASDYVFTGSYWGLNREIVQLLDPAALPFEFVIYGGGWEQVAHLAPYSRGTLPYRRMPDVYASTRIVIDDANHVTKAWGAVNSRVFDAIAAGALVLTNGSGGSADMFDGKLPTYATPQELEDLLWTYLGDEAARRAKVAELQRIVEDRHTYQKRARSVWALIGRASHDQLRIAIKIGAPSWRVREEWGDYHFAMSMKYCLDQCGHTTRIDCLDTWQRPSAIGDDVVIVLRGLSAYKPRPNQINLMWNISHPDKISLAEYAEYDHVFVASTGLARTLEPLLGDRVSPLLQCTDPRFFNPDVAAIEPAPQVLFVGNSRNVFRRIVRDALQARLPLEVYGTRWEGFLTDAVLRGDHIPNDRLAGYYKSAGVLLNDHWDNMAAAGILSNRLFDAAACGARIVSDAVEGIDEIFHGHVASYRDADDLNRLVTELLSEDAGAREARRELAREVIEKHSFAARVNRILSVVAELVVRKAAVPAEPVLTALEPLA